MNSPSPRLFALTPLFCIGMTTFTSIPNVVSTYIPKTAEFFYYFTDSVNIDAYVVDIVGGGADVVRNGGLSSVGSALAIFLPSYYPLHTWWRPDRWWVAALVSICAWFVIIGGFRSGLISFVFAIGLAVWCYSSWRALVLLPPLAMVIIGAVFLQNSHLVSMPLAAQRSLSFLPGDWDAEVKSSTDSSNDFRERIRSVYLHDDAGKHPFFGNGVTYDGAEFATYNSLAQTSKTEDSYYTTKIFLAAKMFHTGWISAYDAVGLVGSFFLTMLASSLIWVSGRMACSPQADRQSSLFPLKVWLFCNVTSGAFAFVAVFGDIRSFFPGLCFTAAVLTHLNRLEKFGYRPPATDRMVPFDPERAKIPVPA